MKIKTRNWIRTSSEIKSYRSIRHATGAPLAHCDSGRMKLAEEKRLAKMDRDIWLAEEYAKRVRGN